MESCTLIEYFNRIKTNTTTNCLPKETRKETELNSGYITFLLGIILLLTIYYIKVRRKIYDI